MSFLDIAALSLHDIKNRLAAMAARAEARGDSETLRDALGAAGQLTRLLACYKADAGVLRPEIDARCPAELLTELQMEGRRLSAFEIVVDCERAPSLWFYDEYLVRMLLNNALQNAIRFARRRITLAACETDDCLEFRVSDDGDGYPEEILASQTRAAQISPEGVGIGLYLAHRVAALHQNHGLAGSVSLTNDGGAVFRLRLPR
jgi:signal transduction histidine kinase